MLQSLASAPPSAFGQAVSAAVAATPRVQSAEKLELEKSFPTVDQPTGLPRIDPPKPPTPTVLSPGQPPETAAPGSRQQQPPDTSHPAPSAPLPATSIRTQAAEPEEEEGAGWWSWLTNRVGSFLSAIPMYDAGVDTSAGARPNVDLTGDADTRQNEQQQSAGQLEVTMRRVQADAATEADFGEDRIYPTLPLEKLRPSYKPTAPGGIAGFEAPAPPGPADAHAAFDQEAGPWLRGKVGEQADAHRADQETYRQKSQETRLEGERRIKAETERSRGEQVGIQNQARGEVASQRRAWVEQNREVQDQYAKASVDKRKEIDEQVDSKVKNAERDADQKLTDAEKQADDERKKAEEKVADKKREEENKPRSWWDSVKGAISSVFNAIKDAVNAIFDALRSIVKGIIEAAKAVVRGIIEVARMAVVGLIKAFGEFVKGLVSLALIAFPDAAAKARGWIDGKVNGAVTAVNKVADTLKKATDAILDWVGGVLDIALAFVQKAYTLYLEALRLLATGEIFELLEKIANLGEAAWEGAKQIEGEIWKELIGFDLTKDLSGQMAGDADKAGASTPDDAAAQASGDPANLEFFQQEQLREDQIVVGETPELEVDDELRAKLADVPDGGELHIGEDADSERSADGIRTELLSTLEQEPPDGTQAEAALETAQQDPEMQAILARLARASTRAERFAVVKDLIVAGINRFWEEKVKPNLWVIIPALIVAVAAIIAAEILTGGAITLALPVIIKAVTVLFLAHDISKVMAAFTQYLEKGWAGDVAGAATSFARGIAVGVVAALTYFLFEYGGRAIKAALKGVGGALATGGRAVARGAAKVARGVAKGVLYVGKMAVKAAKIGARIVSKSGKFVLEKGKLIVQGVTRAFARGAKSLDDLFKRLRDFFHRFKGFYAQRRGEWIDLYAIVNPKRIYLGSIWVGKKGVQKAIDDVLKAGEKLDNATRKRLQDLAVRFGERIASGKPLGKIRGELEKFLQSLAPQHMGTNPVLKEAWERTLQKMAKDPTWRKYLTAAGEIRTKDPKIMLRLYAAAEGRLATQVKIVMEEIEETFGAMKGQLTDITKGVQLHHLLYKSKFPAHAITPENLVLALRKASGGQLDELHDLIHWISAGALKAGGKTRWTTLMDEMADIIKKVYGL
jgi:hypothetical protein